MKIFDLVSEVWIKSSDLPKVHLVHRFTCAEHLCFTLVAAYFSTLCTCLILWRCKHCFNGFVRLFFLCPDCWAFLWCALQCAALLNWMYLTRRIWAFLQCARHCLTGCRGPLMPRAHLLPQFKRSSTAAASSSTSSTRSPHLAGKSILDHWGNWTSLIGALDGQTVNETWQHILQPTICYNSLCIIYQPLSHPL